MAVNDIWLSAGATKLDPGNIMRFRQLDIDTRIATGRIEIKHDVKI